MNIKKVKEALSMASFELPELSSAPNGKEPHAIKASRLVKEALAELEKPADDDAMDVADRIRAICFDETMGYDSFMAESLIKDFAESYHAKQCAECIGSLPAFPHRPSRLPESRSGVTTDVDK